MTSEFDRSFNKDMPANSYKTRERILSAAEQLFAERGIDGVSMRDIAAIAMVPLALVSYHFGSKDALYRSIFTHRYEPLTEERMARLNAVDLKRPGAATLRQIVAAFLEPILRLRKARGGRHFAVLLAREASDPNEGRRGILSRYLDPTGKAFIDALQRALPKHSKADIAWGYQFLVGALVMNLCDTGRVTRLSGGVCKSGDTDAALERMVRFAAKGFEACRADGRSKAISAQSSKSIRRRSA